MIHLQPNPTRVYRFIVMSIDRHTGEVRWQQTATEEVPHRVRGYDLTTGRLIWQCGGLSYAVVSSPVTGQGLVLSMTAYPRQVLIGIPLDSSGDVTGKMAWRYNRDTSYVPSALLYDETFYFLKSSNTILSAVDSRTGRPMIRPRRLPNLTGRVYASPVGASGRVYITARDGTTLVVAHDKTLKPLAVNKLGDPIDASAAIAGDQIFLRSQSHLYCIENQ